MEPEPHQAGRGTPLGTGLGLRVRIRWMPEGSSGLRFLLDRASGGFGSAGPSAGCAPGQNEAVRPGAACDPPARAPSAVPGAHT